jgi:hypothetical protein
MSAAAPATLPVAPHPEPPSAAAGAHPRGGGLTIKVPLRLVVGAQYADAALSVYVKIAALSLRPEGCRARVDTLASYLGMSKSAVERALRQLANPDPINDVVEVPSTRKTARGGTGESAHRTTRPLAAGELWVRIPVRASEALSPRLLRLYAVLTYITTRRIPVTLAELGEMLHHHSGKRAGEHLSERQAKNLVDDLAETGWITVHRREGAQARHAYETHRHPLHPVADPAPAAGSVEDQGPEQLALWGTETPEIEDGSGLDLGDGSLASKEDHRTDRPEKTQLGGGIRRRRGDRKWVAGSVDGHVPDTFGPGDRVLRTDAEPDPARPAADRAYTGPVLQLSPRIWNVLEPLRHELGAIRPYLMRRIAREIGAQLDAGVSPERLAERLERRYATTEPVRDIGRWILGAGLPRRGCGLEGCESGVVWETGADCETCAVNRQVVRAREQRERELAASEERLARRRLEQQARAAAAEDCPALGLVDQEPPAPADTDTAAAVVAWPPKASFRERDRATAEEIRAAIAAYGPAGAVHVYGLLRAAPYLTDSDLPATGTAGGTR